VCAAVEAPDPDTLIVVGEFVALLTTVIVPERLPVVIGTNIALNDVDWLAANDNGKVIPAAENEVFDTLTWEITTAEFPVFVSVTVCVATLPVFTVAKASELGEADSERLAAVPVPESGMTNGDAGTLQLNEIPPEKVAAELGVNATVNADDPPGVIVSGSVNPVLLNPAPVRLACDKVRFAVPGLLIVTVCEFVKPTVTLLKLTLEGITEIAGCTPVPLRAIVAGEFVALLTTLSAPAELPTPCGAKVTDTGKL
jgi:hypothetical protein